jgi:hypothetical protein
MASKSGTATSSHKVVVDEVIQATSYTYLNVDEDGESYWIAIAKREVEKGETLYYSNSLEMKDFESKELDRTFETILFVQDISNEPIPVVHGMPKVSTNDRKISKKDESISIEPLVDGVTVKELSEKREEFEGKIVKIRGQVTKFNPSIMGKNWVHIQDGTNHQNIHDLTITTDDIVKIGDVVTFEGTIFLNKDFGAGYSYEIIMEKAQIQDSEIRAL